MMCSVNIKFFLGWDTIKAADMKDNPMIFNIYKPQIHPYSDHLASLFFFLSDWFQSRNILVSFASITEWCIRHINYAFLVCIFKRLDDQARYITACS